MRGGYKNRTVFGAFRIKEPMTERIPATWSHPSRTPCLTAVLRMAGLRPTRQRVALAELLFRGPHRHVSAEQLHAEAAGARVNVSLATIYNTLHQFHEAGLLREVAVDASRSYFDTDTSEHHHFYVEDEQRMIDIPASSVEFAALPAAPRGMKVSAVEVVIRVRKSEAGSL